MGRGAEIREQGCFASIPMLPVFHPYPPVMSTYPETSRTTSRTKAVRLLILPFRDETRGLETRAVVFCYEANEDEPVSNYCT